MTIHRFHSLPDQVAEAIREDIAKGLWSIEMPGRDELVKALGVSGKTVETALRQLQESGVLESQGPGRPRRIISSNIEAASSLRIVILLYDQLPRTEGYMMEILYDLNEAGYTAFFGEKSQEELGFDVKKIAQLVKETDADAWLVASGSRSVLEWFLEQKIPAFALFGRRRGLSIPSAGPDKSDAMIGMTRRLHELGHRRIVLLTREARRLPTPGAMEVLFLDELQAIGIPPSAYNLPDWEETVEGFHEGLKRLFLVTPPTALIVDEIQFFLAAYQFCASNRLRVPEDVSLISTDGSPSLDWFTPEVSHIRWDRKPVMQRIGQWAANVSCGKKDTEQAFTKAEFIEGGTMGKVKS